MKLVPVGDKVVVEPVDPEEATAGGIVLPDGAREASCEGRVLSVCDGRRARSGRCVEPQVREGDRVLFVRHAGVAFSLDGRDSLVMAETDILARIG